MDAAVEQVFADYDQRFVEEAAGRAGGRRLSSDERSLPIGEEAGAFLNLLVKALKPKRLLELGTSNGYSTVWLAEAARAIGGRSSPSRPWRRSRLMRARRSPKQALPTWSNSTMAMRSTS